MDTDFGPTGKALLCRIRDAVVAEGNAAEYLGLEAKSQIDPNTKGGNRQDREVHPRHGQPDATGGFDSLQGLRSHAHRSPDGTAHGIPKGVESHELGDRLRPCLGSDRPSRDFARLSVSTRTGCFALDARPQAANAVEGTIERRALLARKQTLRLSMDASLRLS